MATAAQVRANQANAQHSTGPNTQQGKTAAAANAFRHGFRSQSVLIPGDDPAEYQALLDELTSHFACRDLTETRNVREMADAEWRLRRARAHLEHCLTARIAELAAAGPGDCPTALQVRAHEALLQESAYFRQLLRYEEKFERQYDRAVRSWTRYQDGKRRAGEKDVNTAIKKIIYAPMPSRPSQPENKIDTNKPNPAPARAPVEPRGSARNAPCSCGSGRKNKRCCGAVAQPHLDHAA